MLRFTLTALSALLPVLLVLLSQAEPADARNRLGIPHGFDSRWTKNIAKGNFETYHHWQAGPVDEYPPHVQYVPMMWDEKKYGHLWAQRKKEMNKKLPTRLLAFNEPDVAGQANMNCYYAAELWMRELRPWQKRGVKVSTPQIVYDIDWMDCFMRELKKRGGRPDFMAIHSYTPKGNKGISQLENFVKKCRKRYGMVIWVTEFGITASSKPSASEAKSYVVRAMKLLDSKSYVKRSFPLGGFAYSSPPDSFTTRQTAFFQGGGSLRDIAYYLMHRGSNKRRDVASLPSSPLEHRAASSPGAKRSHHKLAARLAARNATETSEEDFEAYHADVDGEELFDNDADEVECDEHCQKLDAMLSKITDDDDVLGSDEDSVEGEDDLDVD